ncbi:hypothetical protein FB565_006733 [Actinoplanes lutulentus]|uniref:PknH-like protein n=1 Tax=Actinoplanes lutulentus TaxID=1287878 RepID=A0A327Z3Z8_9ACTN|nr:hypothetical protein [Actinoplanes lutulentus]MBB2946965.1 hypothetical protein [Actinoplanes lutulentus]RAK30467.1 hypothetical protein B0I29_116126 [Actinoplanes lutulentus]
MRLLTRSALTLAIAAVLSPALPAAAAAPTTSPSGTPQSGLLTEKDLPQRYRQATQDPYAHVFATLFTSDKACGLALPEQSRRALFVTKDKYALDVETLTEVVAKTGTARDLVAAAAGLPKRCATFETPEYTIRVTPAVMPRVGDASTALRVVFWMKAASSPTSYVDVMEAEISVVARRDVSVTVVLLGYYEKHGVVLKTVTRKAVQKLAV